MKSNMKRFWIILFFSYSICSIAQADYYYYKGDKIPIIKDEKKVCVSIPKTEEGTTKRVLETTKVLDNIHDEYFNIYVISQTDLAKLTSLDSWEEDSKSVITTPIYSTKSGKEVYSTPYLNVRLKTEQDLGLLSTCADRYNLRIVKNDSLLPLWYILTVSQHTKGNSLECANALWESGEFAAAVPDLSSKDMTRSIDPMFDQQWGLHNSTYNNVDISAESAWNLSTGKYIKIAILDTGVDRTHIDLASNISGLSYDTETGSSPSRLRGSHGTQCAGIAAAVKDNNIQIAGVAPEAKIVSISNSMTSTTNSLLKRANGIVWAYQNGVDVISNSWGSYTNHQAVDEAIQNAFRYGRNGKGCIVVFTAGNDDVSEIEYPANCNDTILVVGSIAKMGRRSSFSNYGEGLDLVAPGSNVLSTIPNNQVMTDSGTSMACPHVSGVAALVLSCNSELTVNQVNHIINTNAKRLSGINFNVSKPYGSWNNQYGYGLVDAYNSVLSTPTTAYIQNDTIQGFSTITAEEVRIGFNVTDSKPVGNVVLGQGGINIMADFVEIKNNTFIPVGTTLNIQKR